jgi:hypothetical protein
VAAGNKESDNAIVNPMSSALVSRMVHLELEVSVDTWIEWANKSGLIDIRIIAFINYASHMLTTFDSFTKEDTLTYAVPRSYEMLSKIISNIKEIDFGLSELITGVIGNKAGNSFISFCSVYEGLVSYEDIIANPMKVKVSTKGAVNMAIVSNLNSRVSSKDITEVCKYVNRMNMEYQTLFYKTLVYNNKLLLITKVVKSWVDANPDLFE